MTKFQILYTVSHFLRITTWNHSPYCSLSESLSFPSFPPFPCSLCFGLHFLDSEFAKTGWNSSADTFAETKHDDETQESNERKEMEQMDEYEQYFFAQRDSIDEITDDDSSSDSFVDGSIPRHVEQGEDVCTFGQRYHYHEWYRLQWSHSTFAKWSISPKYANLKEELLENRLWRLNIRVWDYILFKSTKLMQTDEIRAISSDYTEPALHYQIREGVPLQKSNVMAVMVYTDLDDIALNLRKTFRKLTFFEESDFFMKQRNAEYAHWSRKLLETCDCYGTMAMDSKIKTFHRGILTNTRSFGEFGTFNARFCGPTSVTPSMAVMACFADPKGMILELQPLDLTSSLRFFNCSLISSFSNEDERLFFGGGHTVQFTAIHDLKSGQNYKYFMAAIQLLDRVMSGETEIEDRNDEGDGLDNNGNGGNHQMANYYKNKNKVDLYRIVRILVLGEQKERIPEYVQVMFKEYCLKKKRIEVELTAFNEQHRKLKPLFVDRRTNNLILVDAICAIFSKCEEIVIDNDARYLSSRYLSQTLAMIQRIDEDDNMKLRQIKIERVQFEDVDFENALPLFDEQNWRIHVHYQREYQYGRWINVANLTVSKWPRDSMSSTHSPKTTQSPSVPHSPYMLDEGSGIEMKHTDLSQLSGGDLSPTLTQSKTDVCQPLTGSDDSSDSLFGKEAANAMML